MKELFLKLRIPLALLGVGMMTIGVLDYLGKISVIPADRGILNYNVGLIIFVLGGALLITAPWTFARFFDTTGTYDRLEERKERLERARMMGKLKDDDND